MSRTNATIDPERESLAEVRLWQAVILSTVQDWISGPLRLKREAENYLFGENSDFALVCQSAGMDISSLRTRLTHLRTRQVRSTAQVRPQQRATDALTPLVPSQRVIKEMSF
jgi:hypothetical protein